MAASRAATLVRSRKVHFSHDRPAGSQLSDRLGAGTTYGALRARVAFRYPIRPIPRPTHMKRLPLLLALLVFAAPAAFGCINTYGTDLRGQRVEAGLLTGDELVMFMLLHEGKLHWRLEKAMLGRNLETAPREQRNDYAAALLHLGEIKPALAILVKIEQEHPGLYMTATNLGTAYELAGKNEHALSWIRAGIVRNPDSHDGTEWLHVAILEAKLAIAKDPQWLRSHSILGLDFGNATVPLMPTRFPRTNLGTTAEATNVKVALEYQLHERTEFVGPHDPIVGALFFDYANLLMITDVLESAESVYTVALKYGTPHDDLARKRLAHVAKVLAQARKKS
jgi:tetratricopeptide (TPR) repeat protein